MSAVVVVHPRHMEALGGWQLAHFWISRGYATTPSPTGRFACLVPAASTNNNVLVEVAELFRPKPQRNPR